MFALALLGDRFDPGRRRRLRGRPVRVGRWSLRSTSVLGGLVFVALGSLFPLFDGTSALPSLISTDTEFALEERHSGTSAVVSDRRVLLVLAAGAMVATLYELLRPVRNRGSDVEEREPSEQS